MPCWRPISQVRLEQTCGVEAAAGELGGLVGGRRRAAARGGACRGRRRSRSRSRRRGRRPRRRARPRSRPGALSSSRWRLAQGGCTATEPSLRSTSSRGSSRSRAQAIESTISSFAVALGVDLAEQPDRLLGEPEGAGAGVADDRQLAAVAPAPQRVDACGWPSAEPPPRSPSRSTASRSSGRRRRAGSTAAARRGPRPSTSASGEARLRSRLPVARPAEDPVDAGRHVDRRRALPRVVAGSSAGAGARHVRAATPEPARRSAPAARPGWRRAARRRATRPRSPAARLAPRRALDRRPSARRAAAPPARRAPSAGAARSPLTNLPVSIPTGQASSQVPSAAQVSSASYSYSSSSASSTARARRLAGHLAAQDDPLARRRGQVAARADRLAEPALDAASSPPPRSAAWSSGCLRWIAGVVVDDDPRARARRRGRRARLTRRISSVAFAPHSRSTNGAMLTPVPCSAFSEPSYLSIDQLDRAPP